MDKESFDYLSRYIDVTDEIKEKINRHAKRYGIEPNICAWYADWEDFCTDWCDNLSYTRTQARKMLHGGIGEFIILPHDKGIVRFVL